MPRKKKVPSPNSHTVKPFVPPPPYGTGMVFSRPATPEESAERARDHPGPHPDHGPADRLPRRADGAIPPYYYCSRQEIEDLRLDPPALRTRHDGLTPDRQRIFIETLAATASVTDAARAANVSRQAAHKLYHRSPAFRAAWEDALRASHAVLAATAFDRAVNGVEESIYHNGEFVARRTRYNDRLLMFLLRVRDPLNFAPLDDLQGWLRHRAVEAPQDLDASLDRLEAAEQAWERAAVAPPDLPAPGDALLVAPDPAPAPAALPPGDADTEAAPDGPSYV